jgi:DNA polymerase III subunit epsilon
MMLLDLWKSLRLPSWSFRRGVAGLEEMERARLTAWRRLPAARMERIFAEQRWVVVDVETSGLDVRADRLIAIGAVAVRGNALDAADSFEVVLRQDAVSSDDNILIHGIAAADQRGGMEPRTALLDFLEFVGTDPLIAYHAFFDEAMLRRACRQHLGIEFRARWLDLAHLAPAVLNPGPLEIRQAKGLDDWLLDFNITVGERHRAVADAAATAKLWLALAPALERMEVGRCAEVLKLAADHAWLKRLETRA